MTRWIRSMVLLGVGVGLLLPAHSRMFAQQPVQGRAAEVALSYVLDDVVTLASGDGQPVSQPGPTFSYGQGARLFWTPDGRTLYIARDDGLYATGPGGGAAVRVATALGRTMSIAQDAQTLYYLETVSPQDVPNLEGRVAFPFRALDLLYISSGAGRLVGYYGEFAADSAKAALSFSAALYVRDGGLLFAGRPELFPTYGSSVFGSCCFPDAGLARFDATTGDFEVYDETFIPGAAALNLTRTHLAGPTTDGAIRIYDLITAGWRDYRIEMAGGLGVVERIAWSPDDTYLYLSVRSDPTSPLVQQYTTPFEVDTRSADVTVYRLNLVTSVIRELGYRSNVYGVSSLAATAEYVFAVVVLRPETIVTAINNRQVRFDALPTDSDILAQYSPTTVLWRLDADGQDQPMDVMANVWGVTARPIR